MDKLANKNVLVVGLGVSGVAACDLLLNRGARVAALDAGDNPALRATADQLRARGASVTLGATSAPAGVFEFAVLSPGIAANTPLLPRPAGGALPVIGELELGFQYCSCLHIAITGTNGKTTTTELIERMLTHNQRRTLAAGNIGTPLCAVVDQTRDLDFVTLEVSSFQLETIQYFRASIAVLLNITPDHFDRYSGLDEYRRAKARVFENQQVFDWAIVQDDALAQLRALGIEPRSKIITISATDTTADLYFDRGLLVSQLPGWEGPLLDMATCKLAGRHNAENLLAALGVARALRLPLDATVAALREFAPAPHRCERVAEINGVLYVNDSKATNPDAVAKAIDAMPPGEGGKPNVWLIAGGKDKGFEYHSLGPVLSRRVKGAFLLGETCEKLRAAWGLFTPCTLTDSLLEAVKDSAAKSVAGDVVLLSPACSSFDMFRNYQHRGEVFREAVNGLAKTAHSGAPGAPTINGGQPPATTGGEGSR